eukprot:3010078-Pleurochrysis_carterae.AAC.6
MAHVCILPCEIASQSGYLLKTSSQLSPLGCIAQIKSLRSEGLSRQNTGPTRRQCARRRAPCYFEFALFEIEASCSGPSRIRTRREIFHVSLAQESPCCVKLCVHARANMHAHAHAERWISSDELGDCASQFTHTHLREPMHNTLL